jgi:hypothetical protein
VRSPNEMFELFCQAVYPAVSGNKAGSASDIAVLLCSIRGCRAGGTATSYACALASYIEPQAVCLD